MECAGKRRDRVCVGPPIRPCARCGAVAYCSISHQIADWNYHKEECERLELQMQRFDALIQFPFTFSVQNPTSKESRCELLGKMDIHRKGMCLYECSCGSSVSFAHPPSLKSDLWHLPSNLCPCSGPVSSLSACLNNWREYYEWRSIPLLSPVAFLLHWPLTLYHAIQITGLSSSAKDYKSLCIHYLGPEKELLQLPVFAELHALFPGVDIQLQLIGPEVPEHRNGEKINLCSFACCLDTDCTCKSSSMDTNLSASAGVNSATDLCSECWNSCLSQLATYH